MAKWTKTKAGSPCLELGPLGKILVVKWMDGWTWEWRRNHYVTEEGNVLSSPAAAKLAAMQWLARALKQASKRLEG